MPRPGRRRSEPTWTRSSAGLVSEGAKTLGAMRARRRSVAGAGASRSPRVPVAVLLPRGLTASTPVERAPRRRLARCAVTLMLAEARTGESERRRRRPRTSAFRSRARARADGSRRSPSVRVRSVEFQRGPEQRPKPSVVADGGDLAARLAPRSSAPSPPALSANPPGSGVADEQARELAAAELGRAWASSAAARRRSAAATLVPLTARYWRGAPGARRGRERDAGRGELRVDLPVESEPARREAAAPEPPRSARRAAPPKEPGSSRRPRAAPPAPGDRRRQPTTGTERRPRAAAAGSVPVEQDAPPPPGAREHRGGVAPEARRRRPATGGGPLARRPPRRAACQLEAAGGGLPPKEASGPSSTTSRPARTTTRGPAVASARRARRPRARARRRGRRPSRRRAGGTVVAGRRDDEHAERERPGDRARLGGVGEAVERLRDADQRDPGRLCTSPAPLGSTARSSPAITWSLRA